MRIAALFALTFASCGLIPSRHDAPVPTQAEIRSDASTVTATSTTNDTNVSHGTNGATASTGANGQATTSSSNGQTHTHTDAKAGSNSDTSHSSGTSASSTTTSTTAESNNPINRLLAGNSRFVSGQSAHPHDDAARRTEVATGQKPFAVIVACADSRVAPEVVFDQGLGDLFVVRCAGNVVDDLAIGSIEYAVEHLGARTIVVVGHERCGAVTAALEGGELPGHIAKLVAAIRPNLGDLPARGKAALDEAVRANAAAVADHLEGCEPILSEYAHEGKLRILAARYDLDTGVVEFLSPTRP